MAKKPYDEVSVVRILSKNNGCNINGKTITVDDTRNTVGNGTWGKIDYLCKEHGYNYSIGKVEKQFTPKGASRHPKVREVKQPNVGKNNIGGINLSNMSKSAMKNGAIG